MYCGIEVASVSVLVSRSLFGIEILHSVVHHLDRPLPGINLCVLFWASTPCKEDLDTEKKIEKSRYLKKDISIPTKRVTRRLLSHFDHQCANWVHCKRRGYNKSILLISWSREISQVCLLFKTPNSFRPSQARVQAYNRSPRDTLDVSEASL